MKTKQPPEPADLGVGAGASGGRNHRLDEIDQAIAGIDIDARIGVSEPVFAINHAQCQMMAAGYVGIGSCAMARKRHVHILSRQQPVHPAKGRICRKNQAGSREATELSVPNIITLARILLVPIIVWAIASSQMEIAFAIFVIAGASDAVGGFLSKRSTIASELCALLDPLYVNMILVLL